MDNVIGCIAAFVLGLILSNVKYIGDKEMQILTILGWSIALFFSKGG